MEFGTFTKKGSRSFAIVLVLVIAIEANIWTSLFHNASEYFRDPVKFGDSDENTIKTFIAREVMEKRVKRDWNKWKLDGVFAESQTPTGEKEITFSKSSTKKLNEIFGYLSYFPLLEKRPVIYTIPVDGKEIKLRLIHDTKGVAFRAEYLYTDSTGQQKNTDLSNSKRIIQELVANTNDHPKLREAIESAMPKILDQKIQQSGTFNQDLQTATSTTTGAAPIPNDVKEKAFRNALEAMLSTSLLRKKPETWISSVNNKVKEQNSNIQISDVNAVKEQWSDWRTKGLFSERGTNPKIIKFKRGLSISPNEIFHTLRYFPHLETGTVQYSIPIDGFRVELELAPDSSGGFTANSLRKDPTTSQMKIKTDISDLKAIRNAVDIDVIPSKVLGPAIGFTFGAIFKFAETDPIKTKDAFKTEVAREAAKQKKRIASDVQERVFRNTVDLIAASTILQKPVFEKYWMESLFDNLIKPDIKRIENRLKNKAIENAVKTKWEMMEKKKMFSQTSTKPKEITFNSNADVKVKEIFDYLRYFPAIENEPVLYKFRVDGEGIKLKLAPDGKGGFTAKYLYEDSTGNTLETDLSNTKDIIHGLMVTTQGQKELSGALASAMPEIFGQKLAETGKFDTKLKSRISSAKNIPDDLKKKALRQTMEAMASMSILGHDAETWIDGMDRNMERKRDVVEKRLNKKIQDRKKTALKLELASSMIGVTEEAQKKWQQLVELGFVEITHDSLNRVSEIKINDGTPYTLKDTFRLLQHFNQIYPQQGHKTVELTIPIGGKDRRIRISKSKPKYGVEQIFLQGKDMHWPGTTDTKPKPPKPGKAPQVITPNTPLGISYEEMLDRGLRTFDSSTLANVMLDAINSKLNDQPDFDTELEVKDIANQRDNRKTLDTIRGTVEFLMISMIAESAATPTVVTKKFNSDLAATIRRKRKFPDRSEMPHLDNLGKDPVTQKSLKQGRNPSADMVVIKLLKRIADNGERFDRVFRNTDDLFPFMRAPGGTEAGRKYLFAHGDDLIPSTLILEEAAGDHDGQTLAKRARMSCTGSGTRKRREVCSLEEVNDHMIVDDKTIKVEDTKVELDVVDRRDATKRKHLVIPITPDELATPQLVKKKITESKKAGVSQKYAKINRGLAVHGLIFSVLGAVDYFKRGDNVHGGIAVSQSLHSLGGLTGFNEIASKATKQVLRHAAFKIAKGFNMERGLEKFSAKVEKFMEKGVGKLMGDLPGVGLAFDIYFIEQDIEALSKLDLNNPEDVKMLPLRVVDLVLDVDTTVLNLVGTLCPEAEVITEPLVIVLSIVRMAIDDFYVDVMEEIDKVNWNSPWAGFEFIGALFKGVLEGAADFLSGGMRREMETYSKQENADKKLVSSLKDATSYYKITGTNGKSKAVDLTKGKLSSFGGFINFRMFDNGWAHLEIGDVTGKHETIKKTIKIDKEVKDIVLGIGESREFLYEKKTAKLWMFIPVKHYKVIKSANLKSSSLFGTYYGNNNNNKFYAVQNQKKNKKQSDKPQSDYGQININFVTGHYHYNLYGRGGDDLFYLGPQMSKVTGGQGSDVYIVQSYGGNTIIDNFAEDKKRDMVIINVPYEDITCSKNEIDLDILQRNTHHIRITNWFVPGSPNYYRHISFKSQDGIIFIAKDVDNNVKCTPIAIVKTAGKQRQDIHTDSAQFSEVKQVVGTDYDDSINGNDLNNILDGGKGSDFLRGGRNEDTYIIRANEGCDTIDNNADDYTKTTDVLIFNVPYERIVLQTSNDNLFVFDSTNDKSCFTILNWLRSESYRHMIFTSLDNVVFKVKELNNQQTKFPMILDYSSSEKGVKVDLMNPPLKGYTHHKGFDQVATVTDSKHNDLIKGNSQSNFLSCTGGRDVLFGGRGSDNYIVRKSCELATIINLDANEKVDLLLLDYNFKELTIAKVQYSIVIKYDVVHPKVILSQWYTHSTFKHIWIRTKDGVTLRINGEKEILEPVEISKDPEECICKGDNCARAHIKYDLSKDPWKKVTRFQLNSSSCSYNIKGNDLNNYIDPGSGNGYNYQHLRGGDGADTYVLKHGYGEFNIINNHANDNKTDTLKLGLEVSDIHFFFYGDHDVILASKTRPNSLTVRIKHYFKGSKYQHLQVITSDKVTFEIQKEYPFMRVITLDLSEFDSPQNLLASEAQSVKGAENHPNYILGTSSSIQIDGGSKDDIITGGSGNNIIKGRQGNDQLFGRDGDDIIFGGDGDDVIQGGEGNDYIYGGDGKDVLDGGPGSDTMTFKGDGYDKTGVYVDLSGGFGKGADAEGDKYKSIENVYGTIHNDTLIGSDSDNNLYGQNGDDIFIVKGGSDTLDGGEGQDRYILDNAYGVKIIDNYSKEKQKDTLSLANTNSDDVCIFLVKNDLHLQVEKASLTSLLYQEKPLTVIVHNWNGGHLYRHLNILFKDTFWPSDVLGKVRKHLNQKRAIVRHIVQNSKFKFTSRSPNSNTDVGLSWSPIAPLLLDEKTQLSFLQIDLENPQNSTRFPLPEDAITKGRIMLPTLTRNKHYIFALFLKYCSAIIASSYSLTYFGEKRACPAINVPHSQITYTSQGPISHGTQVNMTCSQGYKFNMSISTYMETCLDGKWQPKQPKCILKATCPSIANPSDGNVNVLQGTKEGALASYVCNKGFQLDGSQQRLCKEDGKWAGKEPKCERVSCLQLPKIKHGNLTECSGNTEEYGTMEFPKHNFCVKLTCDQNFVEEWKLTDLAAKFGKYRLLANTLQNKWYCRAGKWKGVGELACLSAVRLAQRTSTWLEDKGTLQEWDAAMNRWKNSLSLDSKLHQLACANTLSMDGYKEKPRIIRSDAKMVQIACPKLRFVKKVTKYEGKLETLIEGNWQPTCLLGNSSTNRQGRISLQKVYQDMCKEVGVSADNPGIAQVNHGPTSHLIACSMRPSNVIACSVQKFPITDCYNMLQCKRRCDNSYPVPNAKTKCTGKFAGDNCRVSCKFAFKLVGPQTVYCREGVWVDQQGKEAVSRCDEDLAGMMAKFVKYFFKVFFPLGSGR